MLFNGDNIDGKVAGRYSPFDEAAAILENAEYLTEAETSYTPEMVSMRSNRRLGNYLVRLEDLLEFSNTNGIVDGGAALKLVCEANKVPVENVGISVDTVSLYEDAEFADTAKVFKESGFPVYAAPISSLDPVCQMLEACVQYDMSTFTESNMTMALTSAFLENDFSAFDEDYEEDKNLSNYLYAKKHRTKDADDVRDKDDKIAELGIKGSGAGTVGKGGDKTALDKAKAILSSIKSWVIDKPREAIAKKIAALKAWSDKYLKEAQAEKDAGKSNILKKIAGYFVKAINYLTTKLSSAKEPAAKK